MISTYEFDKEKLKNTPPEKLHELYDDYFAGYSRDRVTDSTQCKMWIATHLAGDAFLEVGSGNGFLAEFLKLSLVGRVIFCPLEFNVISTDFSIEACRNVAGVKLPVLCCDANYLPFDDNSFDTTICSHLLEHIPKPVDVLREMVRVSTKRVIIVVPDYISSDKSADYHFHNFPNIRALDKIVDDVCPFFSVEYEHLTESGEICCCIEVGVSREQKISIRQ